jgi:PEP-CTERM motif
MSTTPGGTYSPMCDNGELQCVIFSGIITPDPAADTFVTGISVIFTPVNSNLANIENFYFDPANSPGLLLSTDPAYIGPIFALAVAGNTPYGVYSGEVTLLGGADIMDKTPLVSAPFQVNVVPEPAGWAMAGLGLMCVAWRRRK